jgi:hypothetical protein
MLVCSSWRSCGWFHSFILYAHQTSNFLMVVHAREEIGLGVALGATMTVGSVYSKLFTACLDHAIVDLPPQECQPGSVFVRDVYACVAITQVQSSKFQALLRAEKVCPGGTFTSASSLQPLRYCNTITSSLILANISQEIDTTIFWDIRSIAGTATAWCCRAMDHFGYLLACM